MKTVQARYTVIFIVLIGVFALITEQGIEHFVTPKYRPPKDRWFYKKSIRLPHAS